MTIQLLVFLPLVAAIIAGFGNRMIGNFAAKFVTTGALFVSFALSWPIFLGFIDGSQTALVQTKPTARPPAAEYSTPATDLSPCGLVIETHQAVPLV